MNNDLNDYVGKAHMNYGANNTFCADRFNNSNSAFNFENGYISLPNEVYFDGDFAISFWINYNKLTGLNKILKFSNNKINLVAVYFSDNTKPENNRSYSNIKIQIETKNNEYIIDVDFNANEWHHLVITQCGPYLRLYVNDTLDSKPEQKTKSLGMNPQSNYIGGNLNAKLDELRIYNRCKSQNEIMNLIN